VFSVSLAPLLPCIHVYMEIYNCWSWALLWANQFVSTAFGRNIMELWTRYVSFQPWHLLVAGASHGHYNTCKYENHVNEALWLYLWLYSFSDQDRIVLLFPVGPWGNGKVSPKDVEDAVELLRKGMELTGWCLDMPMVARACLDACPSLQHKTAYTHYIYIYICCVVSINHLNMCYLFISLLMLFISLNRFFPLNLVFSMVFFAIPSPPQRGLWAPSVTCWGNIRRCTKCFNPSWRMTRCCDMLTDEPRFADVAVLCL